MVGSARLLSFCGLVDCLLALALLALGADETDRLGEFWREERDLFTYGE